jgi:signal transduction histidine kinase
MRPDRSGFERHPVADGFVSSLTEGADGTLWIGTRSSGVAVLPPGASGPRPFLHAPEDLAVLARQSVSSILEDRRGRLWVGTLGGGLFRIERDGAEVRVSHLGEAEGLVDQNVAAVLEDDDDTIWVSTRRGLARFDPATGAFATWGLDDGLPSPTFNPGCAWRGRSLLHFGTKNGLVSIPRGTPLPRLTPSPVALTSLRTLSGPVVAERPVWEVESVSIRYGEVLFVDFAVLDFRGADRHRFAYRFGNDPSGWIDLGNRRALTFTDLDPGEHMLHARGRNANGVWAETGNPIRIEVIPPFWMTWWFQLGTIALVVGAAWTGHRVRTVALERRNRVLEALQQEKQNALDEAHASQRALSETYDRLRTLTRRLEDAKEDERSNIARELHDEMGQALSATKINLKALGRLPEGPERGDRLADTLTLVDGMIRHVRALSLDLRPPLLEELGLVASLRTYAEGQALRTGVEIAVEANADGLDVPADIAIAAFRIVQESVNNVLRHANARRIIVSVRRDPDRLSLSVADDGGGFDLAEALSRAARGGHLGLLGMRERVEALGGTFEVESVPQQGTEVRASVPLSQERSRS